MINYINRCVIEDYITDGESVYLINFYKKFNLRYPNISIDACPYISEYGKHAFLFALDNGDECLHFEWFEGNIWEVFYRNRLTNEMFGFEDLTEIDFDSLDKYINGFANESTFSL